MATAREIADYLDGLLETRATPDYPGAVNGLQLQNSSAVRGIAAAVDFSTRAVEGAIAANANLLLVHHGMFWGGVKPLVGPTYRVLRRLLDNDIAVYSSHLPLDRHSEMGNNVLLARELGLKPTGSFARYENVFIGVSGESDIATQVIAQRAKQFAGAHETTIRSTRIPPQRKTRRWAICSGAGASADTLKEAEEMDIDTLVVGEGPHWTAVHAEEQDLAIIYAGHYATETLGVRAVAQHLADKYRIGSSFINASTGL